MRIGQPKPDKRRLKPPPDYSSRRMQWRLLAAVGGLMLVVIIASEARNPQNWKWLAELGKSPEKQEPIDPRLPGTAGPAGDEVVVQQRSRPKSQEPLTNGEVSDSTNDRAWGSGWEDVFGKLSNSQRQTVYELLKAAREEQPIAESAREDAAETVRQLDGFWSEYRVSTKEEVQDLSEQDRDAWLPVLEALEKRWTVDIKPLLMIVSQGNTLASEQRAELVGLQDLLDRLELKAIQDNTPWRASEREIWFRLLGKLQQRTPEELKRSSEGNIGYAQLFKQSAVYRGKIITIRGTARDVYWMPAPENSYGIEKYWIYWLQPEGGPNSPILVYSLTKPDGFPSIEPTDIGRNKMASLEDVEFTGFYFKRYAYQGQGGLFTTPMLLAREPTWIEGGLSKRMELPNPMIFVGVVVVLALVAAALAAWVYYQYRPGRTRDLNLPATIFAGPAHKE